MKNKKNIKKSKKATPIRTDEVFISMGVKSNPCFTQIYITPKNTALALTNTGDIYVFNPVTQYWTKTKVHEEETNS